MKNIWIIIFLAIFFAGLGIIFSYPLVHNLDTHLPYAYKPSPEYAKEHLVPGDYLLMYYIYWLLKDYFISPGQNLLREPYMLSIEGWPRPYEPRGLPSSVLFLLFTQFGNPYAYNCVTLLSFILCGLFTFLLAHKYLRSFPAALTSAVIFALAPFRLVQLFGGHPTGFILFWIPLIIYLYELLWEKRKWIFGWIAGISVFLMAMEEHHMGYYMALFSIVFWIYKYIFDNKGRFNIFQFALLMIPVAFGWFGALSYMMYIKKIVINTSIAGGGRTFAEIGLYSPVIADIFRRVNPAGEKCIYIGLVSAILLVIGILFRLSDIIKNRIFGRAPILFYFITFLVSLLLSLGPNLTYLPIYKICYKFVPFFYYPRVTGRIFMFTLLSVSVLAGYGLKRLLDAKKSIALKSCLTCIAVSAICIDFHTFPLIGLSKLPKGNKTYDYIKASYPKSPLLEIPLWPGDSSWSAIYMYYTTLYRIPLINGYSPFVPQEYIDKIFWPLVSINMGMINEEQYSLLRKLGIKYINLHEEAYPHKVNPFPFKIALDNLNRSPYLTFILHDDPIYLYKVLDAPLQKPVSAYTLPSKTGVFYECENMPRRIGAVREDQNASGGKALFADQPVNNPEHFVFGPWQLFPPGRYKILYRIKTGANSAPDKIAVLEITTDNGKTRIAGKDIITKSSSDYEDHLIHFTIDKLTQLEFRIIYYGNAGLYADYIYLTCEEENDPELKYEAEDLFHTGRVIDNAVYVTPDKDPKGKMLFGPYRRYPAGNYKIGFRIKAGKKSLNPCAVLEVTSGHCEEPFIKQTISNIPAEYKTYYLDLTLNKPTVLEFRVDYLQEVPLYVDYIEIKG